MGYYLVTMEHPAGAQGQQLHSAHSDYLQALVAAGKILAAGSLVGARPRSSFLIFSVADQAEVARLVTQDPFFDQDMILRLSIREWLPVCGSMLPSGPAVTYPAVSANSPLPLSESPR